MAPFSGLSSAADCVWISMGPCRPAVAARPTPSRRAPATAPSRKGFTDTPSGWAVRIGHFPPPGVCITCKFLRASDEGNRRKSFCEQLAWYANLRKYAKTLVEAQIFVPPPADRKSVVKDKSDNHDSISIDIQS